MRQLKLHSAFGSPHLKTYRLHTLLKAFGNCLEDYNELRKMRSRDLAYWYGERTLTGLLSGAIWRMRGERWALEEYKSLRYAGRKQKGDRGDLWFGVTKEGSYTVEAKLYEESSPKILDDKNWLCGKIQAKLDEAFEQLANLKPLYRVGCPMAVCFVVPYFLKENFSQYNMGTFFRRIARFDGWRRSETMVGAFWYQQGGLPCLDNTDSPRKYYLAPGVIVALQWQSHFPPRSKQP